MTAPKSPTRINIWRNEVSSCISAIEPSSLKAPMVRQPSRWKKFLKPHRSSPGGVDASSKGEKELKTEMYDGGKDETGEAQEDADSSMVFGSGESDVADGGLKAKKERLERAARLLNSTGQGGYGKAARSAKGKGASTRCCGTKECQ